MKFCAIETCRTPLVNLGPKDNRRKYCSDKCKQRARTLVKTQARLDATIDGQRRIYLQECEDAGIPALNPLDWVREYNIKRKVIK